MSELARIAVIRSATLRLQHFGAEAQIEHIVLDQLGPSSRREEQLIREHEERFNLKEKNDFDDDDLEILFRCMKDELIPIDPFFICDLELLSMSNQVTKHVSDDFGINYR